MYMYIFNNIKISNITGAYGNGFPQAVRKHPPVMLSHFHWPSAQAVLKNANLNGYRPACIVCLCTSAPKRLSKCLAREKAWSPHYRQVTGNGDHVIPIELDITRYRIRYAGKRKSMKSRIIFYPNQSFSLRDPGKYEHSCQVQYEHPC
jgi:hypothetical protein